jgi:hypothetical protein
MREKFSGIRALAMFAVCSLCILSATAAQGATVSVLNTTPNQCQALQPLLEDLKTVQFPSDWTTGGPLKPAFGLGGAVLQVKLNGRLGTKMRSAARPTPTMPRIRCSPPEARPWSMTATGCG